MHDAALRLHAPAKLNLSLAVIGRREDGMHLLATEMVLLELADRLLLMPGCSGLRIEGDHAAAVPPGHDNLAWRGLLAATAVAPELACLTLHKRVPVAAGLGGGSSDAAAAWRLARRASEMPDATDPATLARLATVGADVPFFAAQLAAAWVSGIGEVVAPSEPPATPYVVLVDPPFGLGTAAVFAELRPEEWSGARRPGANDLLAPARRLRPELDELFRLVAGAGGEPRLTGSGPTVYTLTDDPERATAVAARLTRAGLRATQTRIRVEPASIEAVARMDGDATGDEAEV